MSKVLAERIRLARARAKLSQSQLSTRIYGTPINRNLISHWEGKRSANMGCVALAALSVALNVSADWLLGLSNDPTRHSPILREEYNMIDHLTTAQAVHIEQLFDQAGFDSAKLMPDKALIIFRIDLMWRDRPVYKWIDSLSSFEANRVIQRLQDHILLHKGEVA